MSKQRIGKDSRSEDRPARPTILIVDDSSVVRTSLQTWLNRMFPDCHLLEASSGEEALAVIVAQPVNIVIMDLVLPQMTGIEATQRILASAPQVQVVIMSFHEDQPYRARAEAAGASAFVPKPTLAKELGPILVKLLGQIRDGEGEI